MRIPIKTNISYLEAGGTVLFVLLLTVFCQAAHFPLVIPLLLLFLGVYLFFFKKANLVLFLRLGLLLTGMLFTVNYINQYTTISPLFIPVASVAMLTMLLFNDLQLSFVMSFITSVCSALILEDHRQLAALDISGLTLSLIFFFGGLTAAFCVRDARTRGRMISAGVYVGFIQVVTIMLLHPEMSFMLSKQFALEHFRPLFLNGIVSSLVVMFTLKIFENWFRALTNFSLLELSDFNQPLLKRMILEAPGTYHHSLVVSNLSEAAADAIGAHALLTRIGAYYHDIGKMDKAEYFTENQLVGGNKHDHIEPSMSRLVILNHVKEGIELARKYKLNERIIDFIPQHHGTSLIHYFYQRALEESTDPEEVKEELFRYPGPKPQTRETAIVLLADSVEGATRAIDEPNLQKITEVVRKVINNKFIDGQLDECNLTLKEIELIASTFTRVLSAMYHSRIKYPEKKNAPDHRHPKSTETNPS